MRPLGVSVSSVNIQKFSLCFSLSLIFSVLMSTWRICSISMNFACVLKLWLFPEKWRLAGIASGYHIYIRHSIQKHQFFRKIFRRVSFSFLFISLPWLWNELLRSINKGENSGRYKLLKVRYCVLENVSKIFYCHQLDDLNLNS